MRYRHTKDMGTILGGEVEEIAQDMLEAGVNWIVDQQSISMGTITLAAHVDQDSEMKFQPDNIAATALSNTVILASNGHVTPAVHFAVMARLVFIALRGWDAYCVDVREEVIA